MATLAEYACWERTHQVTTEDIVLIYFSGPQNRILTFLFGTRMDPAVTYALAVHDGID